MANANENIIIGFETHLVNNLLGIHGIVEPSI